MTDYIVTVNEEEILADKNDAKTLDIGPLDSAGYHLLQDNRAYEVKVLRSDFSNKTLTLAVNGNTYKVKIEDEYDQQVKKMGMLSVNSQKVNAIKAPMPGLIVDVMVKAGQEIKEGTPLIVLSAMKMENIILSQGDGVVKTIEVKKNDAVEKGQLIVEME